MEKKLLPIIIAIIMVGACAFYGGMKYGESKTPVGGGQEQMQSRFQQMGAAGTAGAQRGARNGGDFVSGEIISKDEQSLTLKMPDGGSKIVFFSDSIKILKTVEGSAEDIAAGKQIMVSGKQNSDGSYTAQTIQERQ